MIDELTGTIDPLALLERVVRVTSLDAEGVELELEQGQIQPGGSIELVEGPLAARFAGFAAEGQARVRMDSTEPKMGRHADALVWVDFSRYGMRRRLDGLPALRGERLLMHARSSADREDFPPRKIDGQLQLGQAEFPDLAFVNDLIPPGAGLGVKGGRAVVEGRFRMGGEDASVEGLVTVSGTGLVLGAGGVEHAGDVAVAIQVPDGNLDQRVFSLDGTWLGLDRFAFTNRGTAGTAPDFWARFTLTEGRLDLGQTPGLDTRLELALSDTRPLVAFLSRDEPLAGWKEKLLTMNEITGRGDLVLTKETATFRHAEVSGGKVDIEGRVFIGDEGPLGKAIGRYGILEVGIGLAGRERNVKAFGAEGWYEKDDIPGMPPLVREPVKGQGR